MADATAIASEALEDSHPEASSTLGWVSFATGLIGAGIGIGLFAKTMKSKLSVFTSKLQRINGKIGIPMSPLVDGEHYLLNQGGLPIDRKIIGNQIINDNISFFQMRQNNVRDVIESIIYANSRRPKNEYLFALSESKGMRIFTKGFNYIGFKQQALHHQNIFTNNSDILSVGTMFVYKNKMMVTNASGHFKPSLQSLEHVKSFFKKGGISTKRFVISDYKKINSIFNESGYFSNIRNWFR